MVYRFLVPLAAVALLAAAQPAAAATILEKSVDVEIQPDGDTVERSSLRVRLDSIADFVAWSPYAIYFDENRQIESVTASVTTPDGKTSRVPESEMGTADVKEAFRSSSKVRTVRFPAVPAGSVLTVEVTARQHSEFRADGISLASEKAPIERLRVAVHGSGSGWRWRIGGSRAGLTVQESTGGVVVTGTSLPALKKERFAPGDRSRGPVLRFAWGEEATWSQVGRWYEGLLASLPRDSSTVDKTARELTVDRGDRRHRLASLLAFVRGKVRYTAAEAGIAGHRPTAPAEVLDRKWGDCKDKALLLIALLRAAGVEAYPALIHLGSEDRIDAEFPSPFQFNHVIVAVAADGVAAPGDPVAGGFLFVDPTQTGASIRWLQPAVQDQDALVVRSAASALVRTPIRQEIEGGRIEARLTLTPQGDAEGEASFAISGDAGAAFAGAFAGSGAEEIEPAVREVFGQLLPGAALSQVRWTISDADVPAVTLSAHVRLPALVQDSGGSRSVGLPQMAGTPGLAVLQDRDSPVVLSPKSNHFSWRIEIPEGWCPPRSQTVEVGNTVGTFRQSVSTRGRIVEIGRDLEIRQRWIEPAAFADLKALSAADHQEDQRRIRLDCGAGAVAAGGL
ncbi:MAG TPA: DUF3857 domain-containing protein [Thermoanaerobaculia bacterium]|nr:DUF3857 domain-containing protein [Thermoanaerobaculia bacterium]